MNLDFASLIVAERDILASRQSDRLKLNSLGEIYYDCSLSILAKSEELLNLATRKIDLQEDVAIDESFEEYLQGWLCQSVSVKFLDLYLQPRKRKEYNRESNSVEITSITSTEAVTAFAIDDEDISQTLEVAHEESVREWAETLVEVMAIWNCDCYSFSQLSGLSNLSTGRVFLALFLDERFMLRRKNSFYEEIVVSLACYSG